MSRNDPSYVKQHFVPRFYLANFSPDGGKALCLYDFQSGNHAARVSAESQCFEKYFYGADGELEKHLAADVDGPASDVIRNIINKQELPLPNSEEIVTLCLFIAYQRSRTANARDDSADFIDKSGKHMFKTYLELNNRTDIKASDIDNCTISVDHPSQLAVSSCPTLLPYFTTLKIKLYVNNTSHEFITSDNPVALINPYFSKIKRKGVTGWAIVGLQAVVPLSPKAAVVLYDPEIYTFGNDEIDSIPIINPNDIDNINTLQILNSKRFLYYSGDNQRQTIDASLALHAGLRISIDREIKTESITDLATGEKQQVLHITAGTIDYRYALPHSRQIQGLKSSGDFIRKRETMMEYEGFLIAAQAGKYGPNDMLRYLRDQMATKEYHRRIVVTAGMSGDQFHEWLNSPDE